MNELHQCLDKREWDDYIIENGGHPLQLWGWGDVKASHGWKASRLFLRDEEEKVIGAVQVLIRKLPLPLKSLAYVPRGPIVDESNREVLLSALAKHVKKTWKSVALMIEPDSEEYTVPSDWVLSENRILPSNTIILNLENTESELLAAMAKKTRQYIRKSASEKIQIKRVKTRDELRKCLAIYHETAKRAGFDIHKDQYYHDVYDKLGEYSVIFAAFQDDTPIAFVWLAISADTAIELYGGMNEVGKELRVNYALKWHAIRTCKDWGLLRYDFGGLIDGGVSTFKKNWTDQDTMLAGTFEIPLSMYYGVWRKGMPVAKNAVRKVKHVFKQ